MNLTCIDIGNTEIDVATYINNNDFTIGNANTYDNTIFEYNMIYKRMISNIIFPTEYFFMNSTIRFSQSNVKHAHLITHHYVLTTT